MYFFFFFQAEDGIRDLVRSRGLGDVYKRQVHDFTNISLTPRLDAKWIGLSFPMSYNTAATIRNEPVMFGAMLRFCLLYTSDAADERSSVDLGGRRII
mgnify:CR=1 FL=1